MAAPGRVPEQDSSPQPDSPQPNSTQPNSTQPNSTQPGTAETSTPHPRPEHPASAQRNETPAERSDRNWNELLQELRVAQTGVQILTGFLLTVPFQGRFADLDEHQVRLYLSVLLLSILTTGLIVTPVPLHRLAFGRHLKAQLVTDADRIARIGLATLVLVLSGTTMLIFDVVLSRRAGHTAGLLMLAVLMLMWWVIPARLAGKSPVDPPGNS